jgi:hypothetical protein
MSRRDDRYRHAHRFEHRERPSARWNGSTKASLADRVQRRIAGQPASELHTLRYPEMFAEPQKSSFCVQRFEGLCVAIFALCTRWAGIVQRRPYKRR